MSTMRLRIISETMADQEGHILHLDNLGFLQRSIVGDVLGFDCNRDEGLERWGWFKLHFADVSELT